MKMTQYLQNYRIWVGTMCGSILLSLSVVPIANADTHTAQVNPKPSIFNEPAYNRQRDSITKPLSAPIIPPLPEEQHPVSATVVPVNGKVNVRFTNHTNAAIAYEIVGHTNQRLLSGQSNVALNDLPVPVAVTFRRPDNGLLAAHAQVSSQPGLLQIIFDEATDLKVDRVAMRIEKTGNVFLK